jgi:hypothetical protein
VISVPSLVNFSIRWLKVLATKTFLEESKAIPYPLKVGTVLGELHIKEIGDLNDNGASFRDIQRYIMTSH